MNRFFLVGRVRAPTKIDRKKVVALLYLLEGRVPLLK